MFTGDSLLEPVRLLKGRILIGSSRVRVEGDAIRSSNRFA